MPSGSLSESRSYTVTIPCWHNWMARLGWPMDFTFFVAANTTFIGYKHNKNRIKHLICIDKYELEFGMVMCYYKNATSW